MKLSIDDAATLSLCQKHFDAILLEIFLHGVAFVNDIRICMLALSASL
jgi:hypothetical protein